MPSFLFGIIKRPRVTPRGALYPGEPTTMARARSLRAAVLLIALVLAPRLNTPHPARTDGAILLARGDDAAHRRHKDLAAPSRSFLTTLQSAVRVHRRSLAGDGRFVVHVVGAVAKIEGRVAWPYAGHHACDKTTMVLVGREMPDEDPPPDHVDGCDTRFVRGAYTPANLARGLDDPREALADMVILFNADAWGCQWRRTMLHLATPRHDLVSDSGSRTFGRFDDVAGAPVIVTGYERGDVARIERMIGAERARWFSASELRRCDEIVERMYGKDGKKDDANEGGNEDEGSYNDGKLGTTVRSDIYEDDANVLKLGAPVVHWGTSPNRPEDNAPGDPNAFWFSFSPGLVSTAGEGSINRKGSAAGVGVVDGDLAVGAVAVVVVPLAAWCALRRR